MSQSEKDRMTRTFNETPKITPKDVIIVKRDKFSERRENTVERRNENNKRK